jgi:hypothetical protein
MVTGFSLLSFMLFLMAVAAGLYFLPTIVAVVTQRRNAVLVAVVNTLLGWSFVGWVVALVMALTKDPQPVLVLNRPMPSAPMPHAPVTYDDVTVRNVPGSNIEPR